MEAKEYQEACKRTHVNGGDVRLIPAEVMDIWDVMGLAGEAGELTNYIKKGIFHRHGLSTQKIIEELGDIMWYVSSLASSFGIPLEEVMEENIRKLQKRYPNGFSVEDSIGREA